MDRMTWNWLSSWILTKLFWQQWSLGVGRQCHHYLLLGYSGQNLNIFLSYLFIYVHISPNGQQLFQKQKLDLFILKSLALSTSPLPQCSSIKIWIKSQCLPKECSLNLECLSSIPSLTGGSHMFLNCMTICYSI